MTDDVPNVSSLPGGRNLMKPPHLLEPPVYGAEVPRAPKGGAPLEGDRRQCSARSKRSGQRCRKWAIAGGTVCPTHGGRAPQVKDRARLRLASLVEPAIATLGREMTQADKSADRQRAANSILDRAGHGRAVKVEQADAREMLLDLLIAAAEED